MMCANKSVGIIGEQERLFAVEPFAAERLWPVCSHQVKDEQVQLAGRMPAVGAAAPTMFG